MSSSDSTPAGFNFITVDPSSRQESSSSRTLIRANAGRYIWKRRKAGSKETSRAKPYERPGQQSPSLSSPPEHNEITAQSESDTLQSPSPVPKEEDLSETDNAISSYRRESSSDTIELTASVNHGLKTPMLTVFGTEVPEDIVRRTIHYCKLVPFDGFSLATLRSFRLLLTQFLFSSQLPRLL